MNASAPIPPQDSNPRPAHGVLEYKPENYLVWAILATICCCLPTGIAAIVYAAQVDSKWNGGDHAGAVEASEKAKMWSLISLVAGIVVTGLYFGLGFSAGLADL